MTSFDEDTKPGTPNVLREIRECIAEARALNAKLENVLAALTLDLDFRREIRTRIGELSVRVDRLKSAE